MGKVASIFYCITLVLICQQFASIPVMAAGVNDFYFDDFTGDYYLSRDEEGVSHLRVSESVTAVFPDYNQNKGICRQIAFTNQNGANITLPSLTRNDIKLTRNGAYEPIYSIDKSHGYYNVCTGTEEYVLGRQTYVFEYEFERVVTDFDDYQELYWDTNGTGASQKFNSVTARVHFTPEVAKDYTGQAWCYVGKYGGSGQERCEITRMADGVKFQATDLKAYENLTFDIEMSPGSFVVPEPEKSYVLVWILVGCGTVFLLLLSFPARKYMKTRKKRKYYRKLFVKPEYQPHPEYGVAEMTEVYLGHKKEGKVAALLDMIVKKQVELIKEGETKRKGWKLVVKSLGMSAADRTLLRILRGGGVVSIGDTIEMKRRTATSSLVSLGRSYKSDILSALKRHELVTDKYKIAGGEMNSAGNVVAVIITLMMFALPMLAVAIEVYDEMMDDPLIANRLVAREEFLPILCWMIVVALAAWWILRRMTHRYAVRTMKGLEASRYMDGVKLYIEMAETERLKFLQSVTGVDVTNEGVVHLYEKLLPYAAALGLEQSWMREMEKYYQFDDVAAPEWYANGLTVRDMYYASALAANISRSSTTMSSSGSSSGGSSGWSSSGSSGGGGGGFSGGGGGGGGFSGR